MGTTYMDIYAQKRYNYFLVTLADHIAVVVYDKPPPEVKVIHSSQIQQYLEKAPLPFVDMKSFCVWLSDLFYLEDDDYLKVHTSLLLPSQLSWTTLTTRTQLAVRVANNRRCQELFEELNETVRKIKKWQKES